MDKTIVFEKGDYVYLVGPVTPFKPGDNELDELAWASEIRGSAPNDNLVWMRGQYVEADQPNENGARWQSDEIAIKSLTPVFMPVTVMHDPRSAVGLIADTSLRTPEKDNVPRARIDNTIALWGHRFPDIVAEAMENYQAGTLMQSMECLPGWYDCGGCGRRYYPLPGHAEREQWCGCLRGETAAANGKPVRTLGNVTFTGTGLILGSRGARGAYSEAHLEVLQEEVAAFHEDAAKRDSKRTIRPRSDTSKMEITQERYDELVQAASELASIKARVEGLEETAAKVPELEGQVEKLETEKVAVETERDTLKSEKDKLEETARAETLKTDRMGKLGKEFLAKFGPTVKGRLEEQAKSLSDEDWTARLAELEEIANVKHDAGGAPDDAAGDVVTAEETASTKLGGGGGSTTVGAVAPEAKRSVVRGLVKSLS